MDSRSPSFLVSHRLSGPSTMAARNWLASAFLLALASASVTAFSPRNTSVWKTTMCFSKASDEKDFTVQTNNPLRLLVLRLGLTELRYTSPFNYGKYDGEFACAYCGQPLFDSTGKYDSGSGWPSFWRSLDESSIAYKREIDGRLECQCKKCSSHLGHVFLDGPLTTEVDATLLDESPSSDPRSRTGTYLPRFCVNGASLTFKGRGSSSES